MKEMNEIIGGVNSLEANFSIAVLDELLTRIDSSGGVDGVVVLINNMIKELSMEV